jgi:hypothetical protein
VVEPFERDLGRKLIRECPAQEALKDFLQADRSQPNSDATGVSKLGDLVAQELHQREIDSGLTSNSPPHSPRSKHNSEHAPASNESGYKSSPHHSDTADLIGTLSDHGICQENDHIRQGVQQLQNKINQFQRRDGIGGSPLQLTDDSMGMVMSILEADAGLGDPFNASLIRA